MTIQQVSVFRWLRAHPFLSGAIALAIFLTVAAIDTPEHNHLRETPERAIQQARMFASHIVNGDIESLIQFTDPETAKALRRTPPPSFRNIPQSELYETKLLPLSHSSLVPIYATFSPPESRMQIIRLERLESFFVMTFAALSEPYSYSYLDLDGRPLVVTVAIRYIEKPPKNLLVSWRNRIANIYWLPSTIRETASGDWYVIDYGYSFNLREYYEWVRKNEQRLHDKWKKDKSAIGFDRWLDGLEDRVSEEVDAAYLWSHSTSERQLSEVVDQLSQEQNTISEPN